MSYKHVTIEMKWIDWGYLRRLASLVKEVVDVVYTRCRDMDLVDIMSFQCHWNDEVVAQFYATLYVDREGKKFHWTIQGKPFSVNYNEFAEILGFPATDLDRPKIHNENVL